MFQFLRVVLQIIPWLLTVGLMMWMMLSGQMDIGRKAGSRELNQTTILTRIEQIGKMELVRYNFQEVTEFTKIGDYIDMNLFKFKLEPDAKGVLISQGSAVGCIDLTLMELSDVRNEKDTLYVQLPSPEMCYFKIDLEKSRLYDLQVQYMNDQDRKAFIQELYKVAEGEIRTSAMKTGILDQTRDNAELILKPILEDLSGKKVVLNFSMEGTFDEIVR